MRWLNFASVLLISLMVENALAQSFDHVVLASQLGGVGDLAVQDLDGDADLDLLVASFWPGHVYFLQHSPDDSLIRESEYSTNGNGRQVATGDFDNDGDLDAIYASYDDNKYVQLFGNHTDNIHLVFEEQDLLDSVRGPVALLAADVNGDSLVDLVGGEVRSSARIIRIFEQRNRSLVQTWIDSLPSPFAPTNFAAGDIDGDGVDEIFVTASSVGGIFVLRHTDDGYELQQEITNRNLTAIEVGDLDGDGAVDIVGCDLDNELLVRWEWSGVQWSTTTLPGQITNPRTVIFEDFDDDGITDVAAAGFSDGFNPGGIYWWRQTQIGSFIREEILDEVNFYGIVSADYDRDGDMDILGASSTSEAVYLFENTMVLPASVSGSVTSASDGSPVAGVRVTAVESGARTTTDNTGQYMLQLAAGTYSLRYEHECWETSIITDITVGEHTQAHVSVDLHKGNLRVSQTSVNIFAQNDETTTYPLTLRNTGDGILSLSVVPHGVSPFSNWVTVDPYFMDVASGESQTLTILVRPDTTNDRFFEYFGEISITSTTCLDLNVVIDVSTIVLDSPERDRETPDKFAFASAYPNPFNASVNLEFELASAGATQLKVFDVTGRVVAELVNESLVPGVHSVTWNGMNAASGVYIARLVQGENMATQKLLMIK
ncbi:MAG: VCBS repeat-containing protein [bacterium]|nr:VCBS repeat-containing protein [bacterium]